MFAIRTATCVLFAAAVLAIVGTAPAAEKPKGPNSSQSFTYQKIESIKSQGKPGIAKPGNPKPTGPKGWFEAWPSKLRDKRPGK